MKKILAKPEEVLSVLIYTLMLSLAFSNVVGRYFLHSSISFTEEITTNLFVLVSVVGTGIAARQRAHLGLGALTELLPKKAQLLLSGFGNLFGATFGLVLLITGIQMVQNQIAIQAKTTTLMWPAWIYGSFLPIGALFIVIRFTQVAFLDFHAARHLSQNKEEGGADK